MPYVIRNGLAYWEDDFPTEDTAEEPSEVDSDPRVMLARQAPVRDALDSLKIGAVKLLECGECGREYKTRNGLDKHLTSKH